MQKLYRRRLFCQKSRKIHVIEDEGVFTELEANVNFQLHFVDEEFVVQNVCTRSLWDKLQYLFMH